jgi:hypothetical protein
MPVAIPDEPIVATAVLLLLHTPPAVASDKVVVAATHTVVAPVIPAGKGLTEKEVVTKQPAGNVYVMVSGPCETPVTKPVTEPTVANAVLLLLHRPPPETSLKALTRPTQTLVIPVIAAGDGLTVTAITELQPAGNVYNMVAEPEPTPVTRPVLPTVATALLLLLQTPPAVASVKVTGIPVQSGVEPTTAAG